MNRLYVLKEEPPVLRKIRIRVSGTRNPFTQYFIHTRDTGKIFGPARIEHYSRGYATLRLLNRRGIRLPDGVNFQGGADDRPLQDLLASTFLAELELRNHVQTAANTLVLELSRTGLSVTVVNTFPSMFIRNIRSSVDAGLLRKLSQDTVSCLGMLSRKKEWHGLLDDITKLGRRLYACIFKDRFFNDYFTGMEGSVMAFHLMGEAFRIPVELINHNGPFCTKFAMSRTTETVDMPRAIGALHGIRSPITASGVINESLLMYSSREGEAFASKEKTRIASIFVSAGRPMDIMNISEGFDQSGITGYRHIHFSGHGAWTRGRYFWQAYGHKTMVEPALIKDADFIFSNGCNTAFFSSGSAVTLGRMSAHGLKAWLGPMCAVETMDSGFAEGFYMNFLSGSNVAESVLKTRKDLLDAGKKEAYLYGLFGDPFCRIPKKNR